MKILASIAMLLLLAGCEATTETGYKPHRLGDSLTVQRGYYADPFSAAARAAETEAITGGDRSYRRPDYQP